MASRQAQFFLSGLPYFDMRDSFSIVDGIFSKGRSNLSTMNVDQLT